MKQKLMLKKLLTIFVWALTIIIAIVYTYENPDKIYTIKSYFEKYKKPETKFVDI